MINDYLDLKILQGEIEVDQSSMTGESDTIHKEVGSLIYSGSIVKNGESLGVVCHIGENTFFGKTVQLVSTSAPRLHIEKIISKVIWYLLGMAVIMLIIAIFVAIFAEHVNPLQVLRIALILLVSAVPVALPAMFTVLD